MRFSAVVVAAGTGSRAGPGQAKQWRLLGGRPVVRWSVETLIAAGAETVIVVGPPGDLEAAAGPLAGLPIRLVAGGQTRMQSVLAGLDAAGDAEAVLIHDAARPLLTTDHVRGLLAALTSSEAAFPALAMTDTVKRVTPGRIETTPRDGLYRAQTPQAFRLAALRSAIADWRGARDPTDDIQFMEAAGRPIATIRGDPRLMKLTYPEDFDMAEALAAGARLMRVGQGYDAHRFGPGDSVWLCGVQIPHGQGLVGHSDADVGLHALVDAILGAIGDGDIGDHFPPTDPKWKDGASHLFLRHAAERVAARGGRIVNVDVTLICEAPRIKPHREAMRERLAEILALPLGRVSVKATTTEGMGFAGRREGLAAQAVAMVETPA